MRGRGGGEGEVAVKRKLARDGELPRPPVVLEYERACKFVHPAARRRDVERRVPALVGAGDWFRHGSSVRGAVCVEAD